jgi:hypothetical protein
MVVAANLSLEKCGFATSSVAKKLPEKLHQFVEFTGWVFGSDVVAAVVMPESGRHHERIWVGRDLDVDVAIIALEERVVDGLVFLDEIILEVERLWLTLHRHEIYLGRFVKHILLPDRSSSEVLWDTIAEIFGFPNIEDTVFGIIKKIDSRFGRDGCEVGKMKWHRAMYRDLGWEMRDEKMVARTSADQLVFCNEMRDSSGSSDVERWRRWRG